jgi:hypothetical protein
MSHTLNDRQMQRRIAEYGGREVTRSEKDRARELAYAAKVIDLWNARLKRGAVMLFAPTIGAAIEGGTPWLRFYCPACSIRGEIDLRKTNMHRQAFVTSLIPMLSCQRCQPQPPFAKLTELGRERADDGRIAAPYMPPDRKDLSRY